MEPQETSHVPPDTGLTPEDLEALAAVAVERTRASGERLATFLRPARSLIRIEEGLAALRGFDEDGTQWTLAFLGPGSWFDASTLTHEGLHVFEIVAMTATRTWMTDWKALTEVARTRPAIAIAVARSMASLAVLLARTTLESRGEDVRHRLERLLLEFVPPGDAASEEPVALGYPFTHQELAQAVGASRPHTSFVLGELEALEAVVRRGQQPVLVRPRRLRELVDETRARGIEDSRPPRGGRSAYPRD